MIRRSHICIKRERERERERERLVSNPSVLTNKSTYRFSYKKASNIGAEYTQNGMALFNQKIRLVWIMFSHELF